MSEEKPNLLRSNRALHTMIHDTNSAIGLIKNYARFMLRDKEKEPLTEAQEHGLNRIIEYGDRAFKAVDDYYKVLKAEQ